MKLSTRITIHTQSNTDTRSDTAQLIILVYGLCGEVDVIVENSVSSSTQILSKDQRQTHKPSTLTNGRYKSHDRYTIKYKYIVLFSLISQGKSVKLLNYKLASSTHILRVCGKRPRTISMKKKIHIHFAIKFKYIQ